MSARNNSLTDAVAASQPELKIGEGARGEAFALLAQGINALAHHRAVRAKIARCEVFTAPAKPGDRPEYEYEFTIQIYTCTHPLVLRMTAPDVAELGVTTALLQLRDEDLRPEHLRPGPICWVESKPPPFLDWYEKHFNVKLRDEWADLQVVLAYLDGLHDSGGLSCEGSDHIEKARHSLGSFCRLISALDHNDVRHGIEPINQEKRP